jgi:hypothetical protein
MMMIREPGSVSIPGRNAAYNSVSGFADVSLDMNAASSMTASSIGLPRTARKELVATVMSTPLFSSKPNAVSRLHHRLQRRDIREIAADIVQDDLGLVSIARET